MPKTTFVRMELLRWLVLSLAVITAWGCRPLAKEIFWRRATSAHDRGDFKKAIKYYEDVLRLDPDHVDAHYNKGVAHAELQQWKDARREADLLRHRLNAPELAGSLENLIKKAQYLKRSR